jgi:hypothetical protein
MTAPLDRKDGLFYPGMRRWDGRARVTNNWNTLNNVRAAFLRLKRDELPAHPSRTMNYVLNTVTSMFSSQSPGKQAEVLHFECIHHT